MVYKVAHTILRVATGTWLLCVIPLTIGLIQSAALTPISSFHKTFSESVLGWFFFPEMHRIITISAIVVLFLTTSLTWSITLIEKKRKDNSSEEIYNLDGEHAIKAYVKRNPCLAQKKDLDSFIFKVMWSPDGSLAASVGSEGIVRVWNGQSFSPIGELLPENEGLDWLLCLAWSPSSDLLIAAGENRKAYIWNVQTKLVHKTLEYPTGSILGLGWSVHGIKAVAESGWVAFLPYPSAGTWQRLGTTTSIVQSVAWSSRSDTLAIVQIDGKLLVYSGGIQVSETNLNLSEEQLVIALGWHPMDTYIAIGCMDGTILIKGMKQLTQLVKWNTGQRELRALCWTQKGHLATGDSSGVIKIWQTNKQHVKETIDTSCGPITTLAAAPHTRLLCSAHEKGVLALWTIDG